MNQPANTQRRRAAAKGRTPSKVREALIDLLAERRYSDLSLAQIAHHAKIGRSTLYGYCSGKDEVLRLGLEQMWAALHDGPHDTFFLRVSEHMQGHRALHRRLDGRGEQIFRDMMEAAVRKHLIDRTRTEQRRGSMTQTDLVFAAGGVCATLVHWLVRPSSLSPAEIATDLEHAVGVLISRPPRAFRT